MSRRSSAQRAAIVAAVLFALGAVAAGQGVAPAASGTNAATWTPRVTPWGDPDLQGNFTNKDETAPFERPVDLGTRELLTDEEFAERDKRAQEQHAQRQNPIPNPESTSINPGGEWLEFRGASRRTSLIVDPPDGRLPPQTDAAKQRAAAREEARRGRGPADSYEDRSLYDRCISRGLPGSMMPVIYGNSYRIVQAPGVVAISYEMIHETRLIPVDPVPRVGAAARSYMGEARGSWEDNTLVVETTNFNPKMSFRGSNPETTRLVERFTPTGPDTIEWRVTVEDPMTWTSPFTFAMDLTRDDREAMIEYACHEGNMAMANILSGHRADEREAAAAAGR
ncbi:MAG TPA: hypothetical protein VKA43_05025 [Gammaproteobacteria bacterium]|nr:hypothetical protein [Gammaproteobacteria bacterium]